MHLHILKNILTDKAGATSLPMSSSFLWYQSPWQTPITLLTPPPPSSPHLANSLWKPVSTGN
uniref:Uncharacterized protein n=1 Tax=Anguilla anguilla TaxID=7936 RepID=A0A0E9V6Z0_ANGAN